jgi:hypothetical protein
MRLDKEYIKESVPSYLLTKVTDYFNSDQWFYIKHPKLNYDSPISWIKKGNSLEVVEKILDAEIAFFKGL